ncbi:MAG: hypothetical protein EAS52_00870 [Parapedobacter sp.]|nr:MAG: hypothetical protein EAS52_00870 [Parapedobacter sp.]
MTKIIVTIVLFLTVKVTFGQSYRSLENEEIVEKLTALFDLKPEDAKSSGYLFASHIFCLLCEVERPFTRVRPYDLEHEEFVTKFWADVLSSGWLQRAQVSDRVFIQETFNDPVERSDYIVFFTTHKKDEVAKGHDGAQLGIYFKREDGVLKISGFETIP